MPEQDSRRRVGGHDSVLVWSARLSDRSLSSAGARLPEGWAAAF